MILVKQHEVHTNSYQFENLTVCPYSRELIDKKLLNENDIAYLDAFHKSVSKHSFYLLLLLI